MEKETLWRLFWQTGNALFYAMYKELESREKLDGTA